MLTNHHVCHQCAMRQRPFAGACACTVDGRDIMAHAKANYCPHPEGPRYGDGKEPEGWSNVSIVLPSGWTMPAAIPSVTIVPVPRIQWPPVVRVVARLAKAGEVGIGDTVQRLLAGVGGEVFKTMAETIGVECGCGERQAAMNAKYPYDPR